MLEFNMIKLNTKKVARFELSAWIAHNEKDIDKLFQNLTSYYQELYQIDENSANKISQYWVQGAREHDNDDLSKALDPIEKAFQVLENSTNLGFDYSKVADLEVSWWRIHDELEFNPDKSQLEQAFSNLYAEIFNLDSKKLKYVGIFKAQATYEHDLAEDPKTDKSKIAFHWERCEVMLEKGYEELQEILNSKD
jgi:hypothetical protein